MPKSLIFARYLKVALAVIGLVVLSVGAWFYPLQKQAMAQEGEKDLLTVAYLQAAPDTRPVGAPLLFTGASYTLSVRGETGPAPGSTASRRIRLKGGAAGAYFDRHFRSTVFSAMIIGFLLLAVLVGLIFRQRAKNVYFKKCYHAEAALRAGNERHSIILNAISDAVIATDAKGRVELLNPEAEIITGWGQKEARGKALEEVFNIVNARTREKVENPVSKVLHDGMVAGLANHTVLIARDGTEYQIADSAAPIKDPNGTVTGVVLVFRNVTDEYRMREKLKESERYYRGLIHSLHEDILVIDRDYRITDINNSALRALGTKREEAIGRYCYELSHGLDSPCHEHPGACDTCGLLHVFNTGEVCSLHHVHIDEAGGQRHIDLLCSPLKDENGRVTHMVEAARDVTELLAAQEALSQSEEKYRSLYGNAPLPYQSLDENGCFLEVNPAWLETLGYSRKDVLGRSFSEFLRPDFQPLFRERFEAIKRSGRIEGVQLKVRHQRGHYIDANFTVRIGYRGDGRFLQTYSVFEDITERKQGEEKLRRLMSAIEHTTEAVVITDIEGTIQYVNPAFESITGYSAAEALGQNPRVLKSGRQDEAFYQRLWQTILGGNTWRDRMTNKRKDGSLYVEEAVISPVLDNEGRIVNFVAVKRDITSEIQTEEKLRQAQKMEAIGTLAGGIAHDFNNILFPIVGISELLLDDLPSTSPESKNVREIYQAGKRGAELVKQILAFSRQSEGKKIPCRIQQILKEIFKLMRSTIPSNIAISHKIEQDCGLVIADPIQIHQIAMNLITNAYHAVETNGGSISIELKETLLDGDNLAGRSMDPGRYALLAVSDTGCGIDPAVADKIFEPYFTTKAQGKGTGLGLSTVYGIVKQYKGDITVHSEVGKGTTFAVYLPLMATADEAESPEPAQPLEFGSERIFLVDDDPAIALIEKQMLIRLGYRVTSRVSSLEALEAFTAAPDAYDLVISDMTMPNLTGDQLAEAIMAVREDIPVIICTGFSERIDPQKASAIGIKGLLMKPIVLSEMSKMVRNVLDSAKKPSPDDKPPQKWTG